MRKLFISILMLFLLIIMGTTSNAASDFTLEEITFDAELNTDGSMNIVETWSIDVHSLTNTLFKTFILDNSKYSGITNVKVSEIDDSGKIVSFKEKNQEVLHVDKNCYYGLINSNGKYEIAWGINETNGKKTYKISYTVVDCIKKYNDISELYWQFIGEDFEIDIDNVAGTINIPNTSGKQDSIKAWAHGPLNGNIDIQSAQKVNFSVEYLDVGNYVEVRLAMPNKIFPEIDNVLESNRLEIIMREEQYLAEEANQAREKLKYEKQKQEKIKQNLGFMMQCVAVILSLVFIAKINKYEKITNSTQKIKPQKISKYYRDIPRENATPGEAAFLYYFNRGKIKNKIPQIISSTMLDLAVKKYISFEKEYSLNKKEQIRIIVSQKDESELKDDEKEILRLLKRIQEDRKGFNLKEFEEYAKKHYEVFMGKLEKIPEIIETQLENQFLYNSIEYGNRVLWWGKVALYIIGIIFACAIMGITKNVPISMILLITSGACAVYSTIIAGRKNGLNQNSIDEKEAWEGLKRYMQDYSLIEEREVPELVLWEKYLVYATAFGIADKVIKQLKVQYPELIDGTDVNGAYLGMLYQNGFNTAFISNINSSLKTAYNTGVSQRANTYDYSNNSSGGGFGGGFSGGGGFGGGRRRPVAVDNKKKK